MNDGGVWSSRALRSFRDDPEGMAELRNKWAELKGTMLRGDAPGVRLEARRSFGSSVGRALRAANGDSRAWRERWARVSMHPR